MLSTDLSLSSLMLVMTTLLGWIPMGADAPLDLSRWTRSTCMTHFLRYTWVTFPSRPLYFPRTIRTSSSLRIGSERVYEEAMSSHRRPACCLGVTNIVFCTELLRECGRHDFAADRRGRTKVELPALAAGGGRVCRAQRVSVDQAKISKSIQKPVHPSNRFHLQTPSNCSTR